MLATGSKDGTARSYVRTVANLYLEDGKSPSAMASREYFVLTQASFKNKSGNGQRSASIAKFMAFWKEHNGSAFDDANGETVYQIPSRKAAKNDEAKPDVEEHGSADLILVQSPVGTGYERAEVDRRLGRLAVSGDVDIKKKFSCETLESVTTTMAISEALSWVGNRRKGHDCILISGAQSKVAKRVHGLYISTEDKKAGRFVYERVGHPDRPAALYWHEEKEEWRLSQATLSKGAFARNKCSAVTPWKILKIWKVFNSDSQSFEAETDLQVTFLDPSNLPTNMTLELTVGEVQTANATNGEALPPHAQDLECRPQTSTLPDKRPKIFENLESAGGLSRKRQRAVPTTEGSASRSVASGASSTTIGGSDEVVNDVILIHDEDASDSESSESSSGSPSESSNVDDPPEANRTSLATKAQVAMSQVKAPMNFGHVAAKMNVRSGLRCWCHYAKVCPDDQRRPVLSKW